MGHMFELMGNVLPAQQEAFLTLMERRTRAGRGRGVHYSSHTAAKLPP